MSKFIEVTERRFKNKVFINININKINKLYFSVGKFTVIRLDCDENFETKESYEEVKKLIAEAGE